VKQLLAQCALFEPAYVYEQRIDTLERIKINDEDVWRLGVSGADAAAGEAHLSRTVLITAGIGAFQPQKLDTDDIPTYEGRGVYYFVKDKRPFRGKSILIVGGGDTAVDWALNLKDWAKQITLIHRRNEFRAHESSVAALRLTNVEMLTPWELKAVRGDGMVQGATIFDNKTNEERQIEVDAVLINIGFKAALGPIANWGLTMADNRHIHVDGFMETNLPNVFAAGDIAAVEGSEPLNLIVTGFGQAAIAANAAKRNIDPKSRLFPGHSSELKL
jgi:thioredoxin reductase (NADPH)